MTPNVARVVSDEEREGARSILRYDRFEQEVHKAKRDLLSFLIHEKHKGSSVIAYGAPAKGNTLLNFAGVRSDFIDYAVDKSPLKQGVLLPGTRIPVFAPEHIVRTKPDVIVLLPWNLEAELSSQLAYTREWGARLVVPIPEIRLVS